MNPSSDVASAAVLARSRASVVHDAALQAVFAELGERLGEVLAWEEIKGPPSFNRVFAATTAAHGMAILKVYGYREGARRQVWCLQHLHERGVPVVPTLLLAGESVGFHWTLAERRGDSSLMNLWADLDDGVRGLLMRQVGAAVRQIHDSSVRSRHGEMDDDETNSFLTWSGLLTRKLERSRLWFGAQPPSILRDAALSAISDMFGEIRHFHPRSSAMLITRDLDLANITVSTGPVPEVAGIVDFDYAGFAPGEVDFGHLLWFDGVEGREPLVSAFYDGYNLARTMDMRRREVVYRTLATLVRVSRHLRFMEVDPVSEHEVERCLRYLAAMH